MPDETLNRLRRQIAEQEERNRAAVEDGTVYVIAATGTPYVKIGWTLGTVASRIADMQTGCPHHLEHLATWPGGRACEEFLHDILTRLGTHHRGEWFDLPAHDELRRLHGQPAADIALDLANAFAETHGGWEAMGERLTTQMQEAVGV